MELSKGWLQDEFKCVSDDIRKWPEWMQREAGFQAESEEEPEARESETTAPSPEKAAAAGYQL